MNEGWKITACPHDCPGGCTMKARFIDGKIEIEPERSNPYTKFICANGLRWRQRALSANRLKTPVLRTAAGWKEICWEEAWSIWAQKIEESISKYGPTSLMFYKGAGSLYFSKLLMKLIFHELGGYTGMKGSLCGSIGIEGLNTCTGKNKGLTELSPFVPVEHFKRAKAVMLWGKNIYETHPQLIPVLNDMRNNGTKIAAVEIRESPTVKHADKYIKIAPGSDWALTAWLCRALVERNLTAPNWRKRVVNSADFEKFILALDSDNLIAISGLKRFQAEDLLTWLISNKPVCHLPSHGSQRYLHGNLQFMWIFALVVLSGAFDDPAAALSFGKEEHLLFPESRIFNNVKSPEVRELPVGCWSNFIGRITPPIEVLMIANANPLRQSPDIAGTKSAMSKIPFKVCSDLFMTDTAKICDLVLPASSFLEDEDWIASYWHSYLVRSEKVIPRYADSKSDVEIYAGLSDALKLNIDLIGAKRRMDKSLLEDKRLRCVSDRVYLCNEQSYWLSDSIAELPVSIPENDTKETQSEVRLITVHCRKYINGQSDEPHVKTTTRDDFGFLGEDDIIPEIYLNPDKMRKLNIKLGRKIRVVSSNKNVVHMKVKEDSSISEEYAIAYQGGESINLLTNAYEAPGGGAPYAECFVRIDS
ncbi:MAG: molybdopterin-dependent oxidoreductase [Synergistaceae bacterium]|nr:molybdopterin-dependent oxidoreductase [Synergistaceae bacterium]